MSDVIGAIEPLWTTKNETMVRVRNRIELVLSWAAVRGYRGRRASTCPNAWRRCGLSRLGAVAWGRSLKRHQRRMHRVTFVGPLARRAARARPPLALALCEQAVLLETLNSERFADTALAAVHATLLYEDRYLGSVRTMYRLLALHGGCGERRRQLTYPAYTKPDLLATGPNQVWSWDITKLKGPAKWTCSHLYVILDIFSRYVVAWLIAPRECSELAQQLIAQTVARHDVQPGILTLHADRGASMRSKPVAALLADLSTPKATADRLSPTTTRPRSRSLRR